MHEASEGVVAASVDGLLGRVEDEVGAHRRRHAPPTMRRAKTSMTKATNTKLPHVAT